MLTAIDAHLDAGWRVEETTLNFYPGDVRLLSLFEKAAREPALRILYRSAGSILMDGSSVPIDSLNRITSLRLTAQTALDYIRFFYANVAGRHGLFEIVERSDQLNWDDEAPPELRRQVEDALLPLRAARIDEDGHIRVPATMIFKGSLVKTETIVAQDGRMNLGSPDFLYDNLPLRKIIMPGIATAEKVPKISVSPEAFNATELLPGEETKPFVPKPQDGSLAISEDKFSDALHIADKFLERAISESGSLGSYVAVAMIESAVNQAVAATSRRDIIDMLEDLAAQIKADSDSQ